MIATLKQLLKRSIRRGAGGLRQPSLQELQTIRTALLYCIEDCHNVSAQRLRHKIEHARTGQELWLLRNDAYQLISQRHSQALAAERINGLMPCFEGFMEARLLLRIK